LRKRGQFGNNGADRLLEFLMTVATIRNIRLILLALAAALALAACETDGTGPLATGAPKAEAASSTPDLAVKPETARVQTARPLGPAGEPEPMPEPMTRTRAARECWMRTEKNGARQDLDKRADIVNKCIEEKLKGAGVTTPKT
jgi:hypothetical protein